MKRTKKHIPVVLAVAVVAALAPAPAPASVTDDVDEGCQPAVTEVAPGAAVVIDPNPCPDVGNVAADPATFANCTVPVLDDRCEVWATSRFDGPGQGHERVGPGMLAQDTSALSPDGRTMYVTVTVDVALGGEYDADTTVLAYDTEDGSQRWQADYAGPLSDAHAGWVATSPDGSRVYAGSTIRDSGGTIRSAVLALDAATGALLWDTTLDVPSMAEVEVVARNGGDRLLISASRVPEGQPVGMEVLALDATDTGVSNAWQSRWQGSTPWGATGGRLATSPDGQRVFLGGGENAEDGLRNNFATVAFDVETGAPLWTAIEPRIHPDGFYDTNGVSALAVSPDGLTVYALGFDPKSKSNQISDLSKSTSAILLQAYDAATGERRWQTRYLADDGSGYFFNLFENPMDLSADGRSLAVVSDGPHGMPYSMGYTVVVFDTATGEPRWSVSNGEPRAFSSGILGYYSHVAFAADSGSVIVSDPRGYQASMRAHTTSYASTDGARRWTAQYTTGSTYPRDVEVTSTRVLIPTLTRTFHGVGFPVPDPKLDSFDVQVIAYEP